MESRWIAFLIGLNSLFCLTGPDVFAQTFKEISVQSGLSEVRNNNGIAVADFDKDNDLDIFVVNRWENETKAPRSGQLFQNNNDGTFTDVTTASGIHSGIDYSSLTVPGMFGFGNQISASWGDYDNDGYPDIFITNALRWQLYHNQGDGTFRDVTPNSGIPAQTSCHSVEALWFDYDNDAYLDLYLTSVFYCQSELYRNNGDGTFANVTNQLNLQGKGVAGWMAIPWDINSDNYQDLYVAIDFDAPNLLLINDQALLFNDQATDYSLSDIGRDGMGITLADYNNDGFVDLYLTSINESSLYKNNGTNHFNNVSRALKIDSTAWAWGCQFEDFDNDLDQDLIVVNGYTNKTSNIYYENQLESGQEKFINRAESYGLDISPSSTNCVTTFDYDNDGDMDMIMGSTDQSIQFYENQTFETTGFDNAHWLKVDLVGTTSNRDAIGAIVTAKNGDLNLIRHKHGSTLMAQNLTPVHFGLASIDTVDELTIKWPSGILESYKNVKANQFLRITESQGIELIETKTKKVEGCTDPLSCTYNPKATFDNGSCEYLSESTISGPTTTGLLTEATYSYPMKEGSYYEWSVINGKIIQGQGTSEITVKWSMNHSGLVTVIEKNACVSPEISLAVTLIRDSANTQQSVARLWNEALLSAIREDYARPTVHARNLFHTSVAMYDAWAIFHEEVKTYLIGNQINNYHSSFDGFETTLNLNEAEEMAISHAAYTLLSHRFRHSPHASETLSRFDGLMDLLGYDKSFTSTDYEDGNPAALGNFIGESLIAYGLIDGANEVNQYANAYYEPVNTPLIPALPGNPDITDPQRWQPLQLDVFIDQAGNPVSGTTPAFLGPEWGNVAPFAMKRSEASRMSRDGDTYWLYHNPGAPPQLNKSLALGTNWDLYKWNFALVSIWSSHLNPFDGVMWDISPAKLGNINIDDIPTAKENFSMFYNLNKGGDIGTGHAQNPVTKQPYAPQIVPRGDYARVLAEFWADGPDSETPPGHWFVLLNYVSDHPQFEKRFKGEGELVNPLEWDVKAYFIMGGAMHDAAITAWAIKGWYDFIRPISAIRYLADQGQCTDPSLSNYDVNGIPLKEGLIEVVKAGDPLAGDSSEHVGKIKLFAWRGHDYVENTATDQAGVGWILAENWWPYQRPSFVTPPFAGYVSGHSTYSRAAAEVMTLLTGTEYFPGGMGEFLAPKNEFLVFEEGPSQDVILQWATYRDASDQCSLSRIWGGIHPPADDLPGRLIGAQIGQESFAFAEQYFRGNVVTANQPKIENIVYPVPSNGKLIHITNAERDQAYQLIDLSGRNWPIKNVSYDEHLKMSNLELNDVPAGIYFIRTKREVWKIVVE